MVFEKVAAMLAEHVDCDAAEITPETAFADLGIDSLEVAELVMQLEDEFGCELEMSQNIKTVKDICALITEKTA
ncbi:MAG: acyl carrier protein [Clostridia bacterium]|nr:acyl carrier protein [Clostridia bacterium]